MCFLSLSIYSENSTTHTHTFIYNYILYHYTYEYDKVYVIYVYDCICVITYIYIYKYVVASKFGYGSAHGDPDVWNGLDHLPAFWYGSGVWIGLRVQGMDRALHFDSQSYIYI